MTALDKAMAKGYSLLVFEERYGGGWTALIGPDADELAWVVTQLSCSDTPAVEMQTYLGGAGRYFPVSRNQQGSPSAALADLCSVLEAVPDDCWPEWHNKVLAAFDALRAAERKYPGDEWFISRARDAGLLVLVD